MVIEKLKEATTLATRNLSLLLIHRTYSLIPITTVSVHSTDNDVL
jgi:hypothetical protein